MAERERVRLQQHSESRISQVWREEDHQALAHHLDEIAKTAEKMVRQELNLAAQRRLQARDNLAREAGKQCGCWLCARVLRG